MSLALDLLLTVFTSLLLVTLTHGQHIDCRNDPFINCDINQPDEPSDGTQTPSTPEPTEASPVAVAIDCNKDCSCEEETINLGPGLVAKDYIHEDVLVNVSRCQSKECTGEACKLCYAKKVTLQRVHLLNGSWPFIRSDDVSSCTAVNPKRQCRKRLQMLTFFNGTEYSQKINVGHCLPVKCGDGLMCQETESRELSIRGPNGKVSVHSSVKCGCKPIATCNRKVHWEVYSIINSTTQEMQDIEIDVGKCEGYCNSAHLPVVRSSDDPREVVVGRPISPMQTVSCIGKHFTSQTVTLAATNAEYDVPRITECGCRIVDKP